MRVVTWNVLHRVHAINWKEAAADVFADEATRIANITARIDGFFAAGVDVVALQEASGDQLAAVRQLPGVTVVDHTYPRVPRLRHGGDHGLRDVHEHLVVIARGDARKLEARTFERDPGKGFLAVDVDGVRVVCTHVSFGPKGIAQAAVLVEASPRGSVVLGDFNAPRAAVKVAFGDAFAMGDLEGQRPTRRGSAERAGWTIDHVLVHGGRVVTATVHDGGGLSDHEPVEAEVAIAP